MNHPIALPSRPSAPGEPDAPGEPSAPGGPVAEQGAKEKLGGGRDVHPSGPKRMLSGWFYVKKVSKKNPNNLGILAIDFCS